VRSLGGFLKSTLIGGVVFLLPFGILLLVLGKLFAIAHRIGDELHTRFFPGQTSDALPLLFAVLILLALAFAAGVVARTALGGRIFGWLERTILVNIPLYAVFRQTVSDMAGGSDSLAADADTEVVLVRLDDQSQLGFLVGRREDGTGVVYVPSAPSALSGTVVLVAPERIQETSLTPAELVQGMRRLGTGFAALKRC
jgi:uncharacterized membrane protein